jgi:hypothetical protein
MDADRMMAMRWVRWPSSAVPDWDELEHAVDALQEGVDGVLGVGEAAFSHRTVAEHDEVFRGQLGSVFGDVAELVAHRLVGPAPVGQDRLVNGVF